MLPILFANRAASTLAGAITATDTSVNVAAGTGAQFPQPMGNQYFMLTFNDQATMQVAEIVRVTAVNGDTFAIQRAQENTPARSWLAGDIAANWITAGSLAAFSAQFTNRIEFGTVGTTNWTVPAGVYAIRVPNIWGGGGGGGGSANGGAGGGGGGGQRATGTFPVNPGDVIAFNIGGNGVPGAQGGPNNGSPGGPSSVVNTTTGQTYTAPAGGAGGEGGPANGYGDGGVGGLGSGFGNRGYDVNGVAIGGAGGWSAFGASIVEGTSTQGGLGAGPGGGGSGGANGAAGGQGGNGYAFLEY